MKIATYNVNSVRRRLPILTQWLETHKPDVMCLQETKVQDVDFPVEAIGETGYHVTFRGMKAYNGVATLTREKPERVVHGLTEGPDHEDFRILQTVVDGIPIINTYVPQGYAVDSEKYQYKLKWFERLGEYFAKHLDPKKPAVWLGDLNVAPEPIDVYHPEKRVNDPDFHVDARTAYKKVRSWGFFDTYRALHPETVQYTYWDFFRNSFKSNFGWRIDHILVTKPLLAHCTKAEVDLEPRRLEGTSDHTIVWAEFNV